MVMAKIWTAMVAVSIICGIATRSGEEVSRAAVQGAAAAVELCISMAGILCLWSGISELMLRSGISAKLKKLLYPALKWLFPAASAETETLEAVAENVTANMLGLGNAATPAGIKAVSRMAENLRSGRASDDMCMFVIINTASLQLIPTTVAGVRAAYGASAPFDILPAVWVTSLVSLCVGIISAKAVVRFRRGNRS